MPGQQTGLTQLSRYFRRTPAFLLACGAAALTIAAASPSAVSHDTTLTLVTTIPIAHAPTGLAADDATGTLYATSKGAEAVYAISVATNTITATIPVGTGPQALAVDPVTNTVYTGWPWTRRTTPCSWPPSRTPAT